MKNQIKWELVNPTGTVQIKQLTLNAPPETLEGKTVLLRWNGKHNGDVFLNKISEFLIEHIEAVNVIKSWEVVPETATLSMNSNTSKEFARKLAAFKPDIVIASQAD